VEHSTLDTKTRPRSPQRLSHTLLWWTLQNNCKSNKFK